MNAYNTPDEAMRAANNAKLAGQQVRVVSKTDGTFMVENDPQKYFNGKKFFARMLAEELKQEYTFKRHPEIARNELFYYEKHEGIYKPAELLVKAKVRERLSFMASTHATNEVYNDILDLAPFATVSPEHIIALKSTLFDLNTSRTIPFTEDYFFEYRFGFDYQPEAKCPLNEAFLNAILPDERDQNLVYEYLAHTLSPSKLFQQADLMFYGTGGNGKGTLARVINAFVGSENWKTVSMEALEKNARFQTLFLIGRRVLCDPEMPPFDKAMYNVYKQTTGEDGISVEVKGGKIFDAIVQARYLILTNKPPRSELNDDSFFRRFAIIKFEKTIPPEQADPRLTKKLVSQEELNGLFMKVYPLFAKIKEQGRYTMGPKIEETRETYNLLANPISRFIKETLNLEPSSTTLPVSKETVFILYRKWAKARKQRDLSVEEFHTLFRNDPVWDGRLSHHEGRGKTPRNYEGFEVKPDRDLQKLGIVVNFQEELPKNN